jgi:hypothetical protein
LNRNPAETPGFFFGSQVTVKNSRLNFTASSGSQIRRLGLPEMEIMIKKNARIPCENPGSTLTNLNL